MRKKVDAVVASLARDVEAGRAHVAADLRGDYATHGEPNRTTVERLRNVDIEVLEQVLAWVFFVAGWNMGYRELTADERKVLDAAKRLDDAQGIVRARQTEISAARAA